jgi:ATP-dependent Clp protease adaptor protein ClpS
MTTTNSAAVAVDEPEGRTEPSRTKPRPLPPHAVVVLNDDAHSFAYVIEAFQKVFGYATEKSFTLAMQIHTQGRGIVWSGSKEVAELKRDQLRSVGPDLYAESRVDWPLGVVIEPLPG